MRPRANWPVCPPEPTAAPPVTSPAPTPLHSDGPVSSPPSKPPAPGPPSRWANWRIPEPAISAAPGCASPPLHLPSTPPRQLAAHAPLLRAAKHRRPPLAPGPGRGARRGRMAAWGPACRGVVPRGPPCQGPHRKIPRHPGIPHATQRSHSCEPSLPQPRTVGPGSLLHRLTDPIWGVKIQTAVEVARNCSGGQFLYEGGPCTTKTPYKVGHFFERLSDILGTWSFEKP
jgi:hypothetical protein